MDKNFKEDDAKHADMLACISFLWFAVSLGAIIYLGNFSENPNMGVLKLLFASIFMGCLFIYGGYYTLNSYNKKKSSWLLQELEDTKKKQ
jgi:hypothetical protein